MDLIEEQDLVAPAFGSKEDVLDGLSSPMCVCAEDNMDVGTKSTVDGSDDTTHPTTHPFSSQSPSAIGPDPFSDVVDAERDDVDMGKRDVKATKSDKAPVPVSIWRYHLERVTGIKLDSTWEVKAAPLRNLLQCVWRRSLLRSFLRYLHREIAEATPCPAWLEETFWWNARKGGELGSPLKGVSWCKAKNAYVWTANGRRHYHDDWKWLMSADVLDVSAGRDCLTRACDASWWDWTGGSRPFFWRWNEDRLVINDYRKEARDGAKIHVDMDMLPVYTVPQRDPSNPAQKPRILEKLRKFLDRRYLEDDQNRFVVSLISFFDVLKGEDDIRVVFNGTSCGLNDATWAPWFPLPTARTHLRGVKRGTWMADLDLGEMFYNFCLDRVIRAYTGVDLTKYFPEHIESEEERYWVFWNRLLMGMRPSPYLSTRHLLRIRRFLLGDRKDKSNPFRWDKVVENLPGMPDYDPTMPWIYKARLDGEIAAELFIYIDDLRISCCSEEELWLAAMQVASRLNYLGLQHAARKLRALSRTPGAWAGTIIHTKTGVELLISLERWEKTKLILSSIREQVEIDGTVDFKALESWRGYLIYVSRTYPAMVPYLKGIHQTLDSWRPHRGRDGWKMRQRDIDMLRRNSDASNAKEANAYENHPDRVKAVPRLMSDVDALDVLCGDQGPPVRKARVSEVGSVGYGFGDASGKGYGSGMAAKGLRLRYGHWCGWIGEQSSNYRELRNLVEAVEIEWREGRLQNMEFFLFTDNFVAEQAFYSGTSDSKALFELVLRLRKIEMEGSVILHIIHISGKRMIKSGIDGLSRGDTNEGIAAGHAMLSYVDLHRSALVRSPTLIDWFRSWWPSELGKLEVLSSPEEWFIHDEEGRREHCLWLPAPAAAEAAIEQLGTWFHKEPDKHIHIWVCPRLFTSLWRKQCGKACDLVFELPLDHISHWTTHKHFEPLVMGFCFPLLHSIPWQVRRHPSLADMEVKVSALRKSSGRPRWGHLLRKFCIQARRL